MVFTNHQHWIHGFSSSLPPPDKKNVFRKSRLNPRPLEKGHRPQTKLCQHSHLFGNIPKSLSYAILWLKPNSGVGLSCRIRFSNKRICRKLAFSDNNICEREHGFLQFDTSILVESEFPRSLDLTFI